ncbi:MAG TPA: glycosyl hydrolase, partial [Sphingobacteriaceae bacterium]|nr:glycosyl hydrolase [Sphingobacteriaceae bacterium]
GSTGYALLFKAADVPSIGYATYKVQQTKTTIIKGAAAAALTNGKYKVETDLYTVVINPEKGGTIESLVAKTLGNKEFVDKNNERKFNELRGDFFKDGGFHSSADQAATVSIIENGPARVKLQVKGVISGQPFTQILSFTQGQKRIDLHLKIDWQGSPGIGNPYAQAEKFEPTSLKKAFYDDRDKLLTLFPLNLPSQKVYKNAPFDVTESKLDNTFFDSWDNIKNNVVLNWVDVTDGADSYGMAMLTDHTTNYTHGKDFPLGLTIAYSGIGLWGRNYSLKYPTEMNYALIPHAGKWDKSGIWTEGTKFNEPMTAMLMDSAPADNDMSRSMISLAGTGLEVSSVTVSGKDLLVRLFNAEGDIQPKKLMLDAIAEKAEVVELNGTPVKTLTMSKGTVSPTTVSISMPRFGLRTIKFSAVRAVKNPG